MNTVGVCLCVGQRKNNGKERANLISVRVCVKNECIGPPFIPLVGIKDPKMWGFKHCTRKSLLAKVLGRTNARKQIERRPHGTSASKQKSKGDGGGFKRLKGTRGTKLAQLAQLLGFFSMFHAKVVQRSSKKELVKPYKELERVLHSTRKLPKTMSLDYSSSPEFELFSDHIV
ncbi:hypothetical protein Tco_1332114 [Tanacetum coccineum]